MGEGPAVGVVGASARAAVMSLARAGFAAWAVDLFADRDLARVAPVVRCPPDRYPQALPELADQFLPGPVLYTGGLENHPDVVRDLARRRPLWGNLADVLERARDPSLFERVLGPDGRPVARTLPLGSVTPADGRWLSKPRAGAGGTGVRFASPGEPAPPSRYLQEFVDGRPMSALFLTDDFDTTLHGVTEQLIGEPWLHAAGFRYCGNVGPVRLPGRVQAGLWWCALLLARETGLRGLWGLDFILRGETPYPVEVNPRYTAAVEVLEHGIGVRFLLGHRRCFPTPGRDRRKTSQLFKATVGKAVYFAPRRLTFPPSGPWDADLAAPFDPARLPGFADIPEAGEVVEAGSPVLTFFATGSTPDECRAKLTVRAAELDELFSSAENPP